MSADSSPPMSTLTTVAEFPEHYFLENLAVRQDHSILVTAMNQKELWFLPPPGDGPPVTPQLIHTFEHPATAIIETRPDVFHVATSDVYTTHDSFLHRIDLRAWTTGAEVRADQVAAFDDRAGALNGGCLLGSRVLLIADSVAGLIWRVDLTGGGDVTSSDIWLQHPSMNLDPTSTLKPLQPGVNGLRYAGRSHAIYYTCTAQRLFMRVDVDPETFEPRGGPVQVSAGTTADDFCIDEDSRLAYLTTHRQNTLDRVQLDGPPDQRRISIAGNPLDEQLLGPSSAAWGRRLDDPGRILYLTSDGGTTAPLPDGSVRTAKVLRVELPHSSRPVGSTAETFP